MIDFVYTNLVFFWDVVLFHMFWWKGKVVDMDGFSTNITLFDNHFLSI